MNSLLMGRIVAMSAACAFFVTAARAQYNVAWQGLGGIATQSSEGFGGPASRANDGNRDGIYDHNSVSHTGGEGQPWWEVLLTAVHPITDINVWNRIEFSERLSPFTVTLFDGANIAWQQSGIMFADTINDGNPDTIGMSFQMPTNTFGDRVRVQTANFTWLHLAEVEAMSPVPEPCTMLVMAGGLAAILRRRRA